MAGSPIARAVLETLGACWPDDADLTSLDVEDRGPQGLVVTVWTSSPGPVVGPGGSTAEMIRDRLRAVLPGAAVRLDVRSATPRGALGPGEPVARLRPGPPRHPEGGDRDRLTDRARRVLVLAQEEARLLNHSFIGTEHLLLGLIHEGEGIAAKALESLGISLTAVRVKVEETIGVVDAAPSGSPPFTPRAKKVLELSLREALQLGHSSIGTEHMLLGLVREGGCVAAQVLVSLGADLSRVRQQVVRLMSGHPLEGDGR